MPSDQRMWCRLSCLSASQCIGGLGSRMSCCDKDGKRGGSHGADDAIPPCWKLLWLCWSQTFKLQDFIPFRQQTDSVVRSPKPAFLHFYPSLDAPGWPIHGLDWIAPLTLLVAFYASTHPRPFVVAGLWWWEGKRAINCRNCRWLVDQWHIACEPERFREPSAFSGLRLPKYEEWM